MSEQKVKFIYTNYKGSTRERTVTPVEIFFGSSLWHVEEQWILRAIDVEKGERDFALKDIFNWRPVTEGE